MEEKILDLPDFCRWLDHNKYCKEINCYNCPIDKLEKLYVAKKLEFICNIKYFEEEQ